jgi:hypothetical protein
MMQGNARFRMVLVTGDGSKRREVKHRLRIGSEAIPGRSIP